jgi:hypothetical protein
VTPKLAAQAGSALSESGRFPLRNSAMAGF